MVKDGWNKNWRCIVNVEWQMADADGFKSRQTPTNAAIHPWTPWSVRARVTGSNREPPCQDASRPKRFIDDFQSSWKELKLLLLQLLRQVHWKEKLENSSRRQRTCNNRMAYLIVLWPNLCTFLGQQQQYKTETVNRDVRNCGFGKTRKICFIGEGGTMEQWNNGQSAFLFFSLLPAIPFRSQRWMSICPSLVGRLIWRKKRWWKRSVDPLRLVGM